MGHGGAVTIEMRFFDHTGDFGLELTASSAEEAVTGVAHGFLSLLTDAPDRVAEVEERALEVEGLDLADGLVAFANELLFLFEVEGFLCARFVPDAVDEDGIAGVARGERFDPARHPIARPIKAVTHHAVRFEETPAGWAVRLVFDL